MASITQKQFTREEFDPSMSEIARKNDTRNKIELGGTVRKAGLGNLPSNTLLGLLLDAAEQLKSSNGKNIAEQWTIKGAIAYEQDELLKKLKNEHRLHSRKSR